MSTEEQIDVARAAASRRANSYLRLSATLAIAGLLQIYIGAAWGWLWGAVYTLCHSFELWANRPLKDGERPAAWRRAIAFVAPFITSAAFGALSIPLFASHVRFAPTLGGMLLAGALLNVVVVNAGSRRATLMAAAPHAIYLLIAPFIAKAANPGANLADVLWFGALLMIVSVTVASRTLNAALQAEADAKAEAERRRHEAEEAVAAKSAFVAMISHELRTPISAILAGAARLHSEVPEASSKIHAQLIADAGGLMRTLLNDLLDFSRLEAGRMSVERAAFNLRQALSDTLRLWRPEIARKGLKLRVQGSASLPRWVAGDVTRLKQVLNNLLSNAIKFTAEGAVTVGVRVKGPEMIGIDVRDTGPGLSGEQIERLFSPYEQLGVETARAFGGTGLGLAISRDLARLMGGELYAVNAAEGGARFTLRLPAPPGVAPAAPEPDEALVPRDEAPLVLVVDDHDINRRALRQMLEAFGARVETAEDALTALAMAERSVFDAILMDVRMPGVDGLEATRRLRASRANKATPVIAVTGAVSPEEVAACREAGMTGWVEKPVNARELYAALFE